MSSTSVQANDDDPRREELNRRIAELDQSLEQALVAAENAQEEAHILAEERIGIERTLIEQRHEVANLRLRLAHAEAEAQALRDALGRADTRLRTVRQDEAHLTEELQTSYEELQVLTEELSRANTDLELRVDERTAALAEANAALHTREEQLRFAQKCADAGAWDWEVASDRITLSPECCDLIGLECNGDSHPSVEHVLSVTLPEDRPTVQQVLASTRTSANDEFRIDFRVQHPHRGVRWIANLGRVTERDPPGRPARITGLALDLTDRKAMEESLRRAKEAAESANRAKTRFLAAASHDLRQPIQAAALYAHVLRASVGSDPGATEALNLLRASIDSLNGMLSGLLDLSRLEAGAVDIAIADFVPDDLVARLCAEFSGMAQASGMELRCVPPSVAVATDPHLLERVLRNLVSNAIAHGSPSGKGDGAARGRVLLGCRRHGDRVELQVWDDGPGIPPDARETIFEEFRQLKNPERNPTQGFGLGLSIVARIARLLGAEVSVRSEVGRGSVFSVAVPRARAQQAERLTAPVFDPATLKKLKGRIVLLVEDDKGVRRGLTMILRGWGAHVVAVASAEELEGRLPRLRTRPHVMVTDYRLPGGSTGRTVVELVRRRWDMPGIIITGDTAPERLREANSLGCRLLHKPVGPVELAQALGEVMHHA